jgi:aryl-alcohol dehydrogenase-like predicted oxidoreductase
MPDLRESFALRSSANAPVGVALGTMNFGKRTPEAEARRIVDRAYERGVRVLDTANVYESGESERIVGRAIAGRRDAFAIATKVGLARRDGRAEGLAPATIARACDESLVRLGIDAIDLYYLHAPDPNVPARDSVDAMGTLCRAGKIRAIGVSNYASWQILEIFQHCDASGIDRPRVAQQMYNVLVRQLDVEYFRFARQYAIHTTTYNALAGGLLARELAFERVPPGSRFDRNAMYMRRYWSRAFFEAMERYRALALEAGRPLASLAYGWLAARPGVDSVLIGPATVEQLDFALDALADPLDGPTLARVDEIARDLSGTDASYAR